MATYTYARTFSTSEMVRLQCTGWQNSTYANVSWQNSGYIGDGDINALSCYSNVTITTSQVTAEGWNNSGGVRYNLYAVLYTEDGSSYTSDIQNVYWNSSAPTWTLSFNFDNVIGAWTGFEIWGINTTYTDPDREYPYVYWFNNEAGAVTVTYVTDGSVVTSGFMQNSAGEWCGGSHYVWTTKRTHYKYPEAGMASNTSQNCIASSSSYHSVNFQPYRAFDLSGNTYCFASQAASTSPQWIQLQMPRALYDITVILTNRGDLDLVDGAISGVILGSHDGEDFVEIGTFSDRDPSPLKQTTHICNNANVAYSYVRIRVDSWNGDYVSIGEIEIHGYNIPATGGWVSATPLIWKTGTPTTYTYPEAAMTTYLDQNCFVCASSEFNRDYHAAKAFNNATGTTDSWFTAVGDTAPWLQITMPRPLYNISVQLQNRFNGNQGGAIDGIIYGSNDNGTTLVQIGSFTDRSYVAGAVSTITCTNTAIAYNTVRLVITKTSDANGNPVDASTASGVGVGSMYVSGTDLGDNGGWSNIDFKKYFKIQKYPVGSMTSNYSQDCATEASSIFSETYSNYLAFNYNAADDGWCSSATDTEPYIQVIFPKSLHNIVVMINNRYNSNANSINGLIAGEIYGTIDRGATWTLIDSFSGRDGVMSGGATSHCLVNNNVAYDGIRIKAIDWYNKPSYVSISEVLVYGMP